MCLIGLAGVALVHRGWRLLPSERHLHFDERPVRRLQCCNSLFESIWSDRAVPIAQARPLHQQEGEQTMDEMFEEVLAICLDRLSDGDDIASIVADFPECPDLQPLLELAAALSAVADDDARRADLAPTWLLPRPDPVSLRPTG
jgi:hypothetical protein